MIYKRRAKIAQDPTAIASSAVWYLESSCKTIQELQVSWLENDGSEPLYHLHLGSAPTLNRYSVLPPSVDLSDSYVNGGAEPPSPALTALPTTAYVMPGDYTNQIFFHRPGDASPGHGTVMMETRVVSYLPRPQIPDSD